MTSRHATGYRDSTLGSPHPTLLLGAIWQRVGIPHPDHASRYLLLCEALESTREDLAITAFEQLFQERGLPQAIRSDNGVPFASPNSLFNLSKLSVWWLRLGISIERIKPGHPQQNGRHERMHLTLKQEATRPPGANSLQQQARFDAFVLHAPQEDQHLHCIGRPARRHQGGR